jgi:hypothetical protein
MVHPQLKFVIAAAVGVQKLTEYNYIAGEMMAKL